MEFLYKSQYPLLQELLTELEKNTGIERHKANNHLKTLIAF